MIGTRVYDVDEIYKEDGVDGGYYRSADGTWYVRTPNRHLGSLGNHEVVEHEDGTITVSPSILVSDHTGELWHGWLERGVWRHA